MTLRMRAVSDEEREQLGRMARSRTVGAGLVRRAQIILHALDGLKVPAISARMDLCGATVGHWLKRFNARGLQGLEEDVRSGRPPTYSAEQRSAVINTALTRPADLGLPFASWTLDRLVAHLSEQGIAMRRSGISEIFIQEVSNGGTRRPGLARGSTLALRKKGDRAARTAPPAGSVVVCLDEMGPQASKSYPGQRLVRPAGPKAERAKQEIDYGRRGRCRLCLRRRDAVRSTARPSTPDL